MLLRLFSFSPRRLASFQLASRLRGKPLVIGANSVQVVLLKILEVKQGVMRGFVRANEFVKLDMHCLSVPVLRVLNKKNHEEGNDGCPGVYDELPGIAEAE